MRKIVLLSCGKKKIAHRAQAHALYVGPLFIKSLAFAKQGNPDAIYILSAKHGLLELEQEIEPYDQTLSTMSAAAQKNWGQHVLEQLRSRTSLAEDRFVFLTGDRYSRWLIPHVAHAEMPMKGLVIGRRLQYLNARLK